MAKRSKRSTARKGPSHSGLGEADSPYAEATSPDEKPVWAKLGPGGRIVIPARMRKALGLGEGDYVQVRLRGEELHIVPQDIALRRVQEFVAKHASDDNRSWVDLLLEERRREVEREEREVEREEREERSE